MKAILEYENKCLVFDVEFEDKEFSKDLNEGHFLFSVKNVPGSIGIQFESYTEKARFLMKLKSECSDNWRRF